MLPACNLPMNLHRSPSRVSHCPPTLKRRKRNLARPGKVVCTGSITDQLAATEESSLAVIRSVINGDSTPEDAAHQLAAASAANAAQYAQEQRALQKDSTSTSNIMDVISQPPGVPEVVFGSGKSPDQLAASLRSIATRQRVVLATRIEPSMYAAVRKLVQGVEYNARARLLAFRSPISDQLPKVERLPGTVAVVSAGAADQPVAEECRLVAEHLGCFAFKMEGFVVSSLHRLLSSLEALRAADVVVVVSGLDGSLAPVVAGLVDSPVIAVPTSSGYGASLGGVASMLSQLSTSVPGISVVNIDNGFGGAVCAYKSLKMANRLSRARNACR
ncbi:Phosphoribosylaminoimidazole carboxylase pure domain-containing protein [Dunaliella salina]|uniref:phosphoribosylaminoimidazole carboxylase n=1 Tax=Dunaliella salina TaxID=3046 RepID=A0ABQ7GYM4_DUNSA|nr:Phosphoribosylaminoimidazole carboxylase pure domain-containing protein [Dunaliella salina]|eukprot:KAF5839711.1 Phosphoribosylaminoimidazole carboxylase pure domain-containing protein [Dunaliella salina]